MPKFRYSIDGGAWVYLDVPLPHTVTMTAGQSITVEPVGPTYTDLSEMLVTSSPGGMTIMSSPEMGSSFTTSPSAGSIGVSHA